jgi:deleted-in-malignant-brain-tumors protein 1
MKKIITTTVALLATMLISTGTLAVVPDMIPVQGVLADVDDAPVDGLVDMTFNLYDGESSSTVLWTDTFIDVDVDMGFFTVYLGGGAALDFSTLLTNPEIWMGVTVESDPEMTRVPFYTVPFAIEAQVCERIGSLTETDINTNFAAAAHNHDDLYYTETEVDTLLADKADATHNHDTTYAPIAHNHDADYAPISHVHDWADITTGMPAGFADGIDDDTTYSAGTGLDLVGTTFHADTGYLQRRVTGICSLGWSVIGVNADGSVTCRQNHIRNSDGSTNNQGAHWLGLAFRIVDGYDETSGRLEVSFDGANTWGTVCDDMFDTTSADVVCRSMGYSSGLMIPNNMTADGTGNIYLDNFACPTGAESLLDCRVAQLGYHNCAHSEDVGVDCN